MPAKVPSPTRPESESPMNAADEARSDVSKAKLSTWTM